MGRESDLYKAIVYVEAAQMLVSHSCFLAQVSETAAFQLIAEFNEKALMVFPLLIKDV